MTANCDRLEKQPIKLEKVRGLVKRMLKGDQSAFREIFDIYQPLLFRYCARYKVLDRDQVADIVQMVFVKAFDNVDSLKNKRHFGAWIFMIARNEIVSFLRKASTERSVISRIVTDPVVIAREDPYVRERLFLALEKAMDEVADPISREIADLYYGPKRITTREIGKKLDIPKGTVTVKLQRLRQRVHRKLAKGLLKHEIYKEVSTDE
jgi:RNA polymerase sigma-70 factor (ECF subfamily)